VAEPSIASQLISAGLYCASGLLLLLAGVYVSNWINKRDRVNRTLAKQKIQNERTVSAIHRLEDDMNFIRTSFDITDVD